MGHCWGRRASTPHQGEIAHRELGTTSLIHVCKWRDISRRALWTCVCKLYIYARIYVCVRACVYCVCAHSTSITCILTLRGFGCQRKQNTGGSAVRRRAEKRCSHNKAPRGSLCMQHTAAVRLARSAARPWRATWMPGQPCAQLSGTYCVSVSCAPSDQQQAVPVIPRTLEDTL